MTQTPISASNRLYRDDHGEVPMDVRRVLVQLLNGPALDGRKQTKLWPVLLQNEALVRNRLSDLFLDLAIDRVHEVAFIREADTEDLDPPRLLRNFRVTFIESIVLLHLRQRLTQAETQDERAVVAEAEIYDDLAIYEQAENTDNVGFRKKIAAAINKFRKWGFLDLVRGSEDRYEISPTLRLLFSADVIERMNTRYLQMANGEVIENEEDADAESSDDEEKG